MKSSGSGTPAPTIRRSRWPSRMKAAGRLVTGQPPVSP